MPIISIIVVLVVLGVVFWLVDTYLPIAEPFKTILRAIVVLALCLWLLSVFNIINIPMRLQ